jgi:hypothetical protein
MNGKYELVRAARGPLLLIAIGTLFLLSQLDVAEFSRTWPILIITFGVLKLLERSVAPPLPTYTTPVYTGPHYPAGSPPRTAPRQEGETQ